MTGDVVLYRSLMLIHPQFDPVAVHVGPLAIRWYGLMYLAGFVLFIVLGRYRARQQMLTGWRPSDVDDMLFLGVFGVILGGRLGYVLFYKPLYYLAHPLEIFEVWHGGMSFHGGFLGVLLALVFFARRRHKALLDVTDFVAPLCPLGLAAGRLGNFINAELVGRPTDVPWAMVFPQVDNVPRHPSQLYEFGLEGVLLFVLLWIFASRQRPRGAVSALFLIGYGTFRFIAEFAREPDNFLGFLAGGLTMGQLLSLPMIAAGVVMMLLAYRRAAKAQPTVMDRLKG
jgi:phosphatidylglycerol:prolipoprotein diacylglycerol transferase